MNCEQVEERLSAYLDDMLTPEEHREIAVHLQACSQCMMSLDELRQNDLLLAQLPRVSPHRVLHKRLFSSLEILKLTKSRLLLSDEWVRTLAPLHQARRDSRPDLVVLLNRRSAGLYRCTQHHAPSYAPRWVMKYHKI
ncbi:MAG: anti-sigma factor family protein [Ktedonobacteraceae bacterium]